MLNYIRFQMCLLQEVILLFKDSLEYFASFAPKEKYHFSQHHHKCADVGRCNRYRIAQGINIVAD